MTDVSIFVSYKLKLTLSSSIGEFLKVDYMLYHKKLNYQERTSHGQYSSIQLI